MNTIPSHHPCKLPIHLETSTYCSMNFQVMCLGLHINSSSAFTAWRDISAPKENISQHKEEKNIIYYIIHLYKDFWQRKSLIECAFLQWYMNMKINLLFFSETKMLHNIFFIWKSLVKFNCVSIECNYWVPKLKQL